jgi:hypothetical protein
MMQPETIHRLIGGNWRRRTNTARVVLVVVLAVLVAALYFAIGAGMGVAV